MKIYLLMFYHMYIWITCPYINNEIANRVYKHIILPLMDYSDFMIESSSLPQIRRLEKLQEKAVKYIDNNMYSSLKLKLL